MLLVQYAIGLSVCVGIMSRFMERPKVSHMEPVKRILLYVKGSVGCGTLFPTADTGRKCNFLGFTDSNWHGDKDDWKSTTGYIFMFGVTPISWCSEKESVVALSSYEAEYIVASLCACQAVWLMNLLEELGNNEGGVVTVLVDNVFAINLAKNQIKHGRSNHIEMRLHYLRELVSDGRLRLGYCRSEDQVADLLTKGVTNVVFKRLKKRMDMVDLQHMN